MGLLLPVFVAAGCGSLATRTKFYEPITAELRAGKPERAAQLLEKAKEKKKYAQKDRLLYFLDAGFLYHYAKDYQTSNAKLHLAEAAAEELFTKSVSRAAASLLLNDNVLEYAGEDYEILYANLIKALNYLALGKFDDAFVEIRRANLKLELLEQKYADAVTEFREQAQQDSRYVPIEYAAEKVRFYNDAFSRYLSMHLYAADGKWDDARIDYRFLEEAFNTQPHIYPFPMPPVRYTADSGSALLSVVGLVGVGPEKEALKLRLRTDKDLGLVQILYDDPNRKGAEYNHFPAPVRADYYFKFALPRLVPRPTAVRRIEVFVEGKFLGELALLEDVNKVAEVTFEAKKSFLYVRTITRAIVKGLIAHEAKKKADTGGLEGWLKKLAIDIGTDVTENADLRCSRYLPGYVYVGDFEIDPGRYDILVKFYGEGGRVIRTARFPSYRVSAERLNLLEVYTPD